MPTKLPGKLIEKVIRGQSVEQFASENYLGILNDGRCTHRAFTGQSTPLALTYIYIKHYI